jgi:hypothetical protein
MVRVLLLLLYRQIDVNNFDLIFFLALKPSRVVAARAVPIVRAEIAVRFAADRTRGKLDVRRVPATHLYTHTHTHMCHTAV